MGVLQRFERRLEGFVEGAFARVFGGNVQPVEVAAALQREAEAKKSIVARGRVLVPNDFVVELGPADAARLMEYDSALRRELASMVDEHATEQGWSFVGPVAVRFEEHEDIDTGVFKVRSAVIAPEVRAAAAAPEAQAAPLGQPAPRQRSRSTASLLLPDGRTVALDEGRTTLGRGAEATVRVADTSVSRLHAAIEIRDGEITVTDLGSTNGTTVNGARVTLGALHDGDRLGLGTTSLTFRLEA